ncbi:hypothetical protein D3C84_892250 [compost metagenome]
MRMSGDLQRTRVRNRIIHGLEQSEIINNGVVPGTVHDVVVSDRCADGNHRDCVIHDPRLRYGEVTFGDQYLAGFPRAVGDLVVSSLSERLVVGERS